MSDTEFIPDELFMPAGAQLSDLSQLSSSDELIDPRLAMAILALRNREFSFINDSTGDSLEDNMLRFLNATGRGVSSSDHFQTILYYLNFYLTPVIIVVGIVGNTLSLAVFSLTHLQRLSSSLYLSTLSVADIVFLLALLVVWLERVNCRLFNREGWCQAVHYANKVSEFMAAWNVVSFTGERYITVYHPLRKDTLCSKSRARRIVLLLSIFAFSFYSFTIWTYDSIRVPEFPPVCAPIPGHHFLITAMTSLDFIFSCLVPSIIIVILNARIILKIRRYQQQNFSSTDRSRNGCFPVSAAAAATGAVVTAGVAAAAAEAAALRRRSLVQTSVSASGSMHIKFTSTTAKTVHQYRRHVTPLTSTSPGKTVALNERVKRLLRGQTQYRTARMLLILSSVTVLFNLPTHIFRVHSLVQELIGVAGERASRAKFLWQQVFQLVYFLNFAVNFFVYSACGRQFRTGLGRLRGRLKLNVRRCVMALYYASCRGVNGPAGFKRRKRGSKKKWHQEIGVKDHL